MAQALDYVRSLHRRRTDIPSSERSSHETICTLSDPFGLSHTPRSCVNESVRRERTTVRSGRPIKLLLKANNAIRELDIDLILRRRIEGEIGMPRKPFNGVSN